MLTFCELTSFLSSADFAPFLGWAASAAVLPLAASVVASGEDEAEVDEQGLRTKIDELEKLRARTLEQQEELAESYVMLALGLYDTDGDLHEIFDLYSKAEGVLRQTLAQGEDEEIRRRLGTVDLHRAMTFNAFNKMDEALNCYTAAIETLTPLDSKGDGEAKYDIAGMKFNRGEILYELGDLEKANKDFDEAFLAFRAVEKISTDMDTRLYLAKISVAQGCLYRDMSLPLDKVVDAYNRAMRLYVELIDIGQMEHERELANVLLDRCTAIYEAMVNQEFESEEAQKAQLDDILLNVGRGIEILQRIADGSGDFEAQYDLFNGFALQGSMLIELEQFSSALEVFDRIIRDFADFSTDTDPTVVDHFGAARDKRGFALINLGRSEEALAEFNRAIACREQIQSDNFDLDDDERKIFVPTLASSYVNRATAYAALKKIDEAKADCQKGISLLQPLKTEDCEDIETIEEFESMFKILLESWAD